MKDERKHLIEASIEAYVHRRVNRRAALGRIAALTGSMALASGILAACTAAPQPAAPQAPALAPPPSPTTAASTAVPAAPPTPAGAAQAVEFPGEGATLLGYLARPAGAGPFPAVLICHENRGLLDHFKDLARRYADAGYVALAVDLVSREGGTDKASADQVRAALGAPPARHVQDFQAAMRYLQSQSYVRGDRIGMTGFCFGGGVTWLMAARTPELRAAVPYYGSNPPLEEVANLRAPVLGLYGELDQRVNAGIPAIEEAMGRNNKTFEKEVYPNAAHAFFNDTGQSYNAEAAKAGWARTLGWFEKYLKA